MDQEYTLIYRADNGDMLAKNRQVIQSLEAVNAQLDKVQTQARGAFAGMGQSARGAAGSVGGASGALGGLLTRFVALKAANAVLNSMKDVFTEVRERAVETAAAVAKLREDSRELASLMGKTGPDNRVIQATGKAALGAGVSLHEAKEFLREYEGVASIGQEKGNVTADTSREFAGEALRTARRLQIDPTTAAQSAGLIPMFGKVPTAEAGMEQFAEAAWGIQMGKMEYDKGFKAMSKITPTIVGQPGGVGSYGEAGVFLGAFSQISGSADQAQNKLKQTMLSLSATTGPRGEFLKSLGITPDMPLIDRMEKFARATGGPDGKAVLDAHGFTAERDRVAMTASRDLTGVIRGRLGIVRGRNDAAEATAANDQFFATDRAAVAGRARATEEVQKVIEGEPVEAVQYARKIAEARLRQTDPNFRSLAYKVGEYFNNFATGGAGGGINETIDLNTEGGVVDQLEKEGQRLGVKLPGGLHNTWSEVGRSRAIGEAINRIQAAGGDPYGIKDVNEKQLQVLERMAGAMERTDRQRHAALAPPPLPPHAPDHGPVRRGNN